MITRLRRVSLRDWPALVVTFAVASSTELGLRVLRLSILARLAGVPLEDEAPALADRRGTTPASPDLGPADRRRLRICVRLMRRWPVDEKCLRMALVCGRRIRHLGPRLVIGVALVDGEVKAHAWLNVGGLPLDPSGSATYLPLTPVGPG